MMNTLIFSCASEYPVLRTEKRPGGGFLSYYEVLDLGGCDLSRLNSGASVLKCHDPSSPVGVVRRAWIEGGKLNVEAAFRENDPESVAIFRDASGGSLPNVSIGYEISKFDDTRQSGAVTRRVTSWTPYEVSVAVGIPADPGVGFNRAFPVELSTRKMECRMDKEKENSCEETQEQKQEQEQEQEQKCPPSEGAECGGDCRQCGEDCEARKSPCETSAAADCASAGGASTGGSGAPPPEKRSRPVLPPPRPPYFRASTNMTTLNRGLPPMLTTHEYSLQNVLSHLAGARSVDIGYEREISARMISASGVSLPSNSIMVPGWALCGRRDMTGTGDGANNAALIGTDHRADEFVRLLKKRMGVQGARVMGGLVGNVEIPIQTGHVTVGWGTINSNASETNPTTSKITLSPKKLSAYVDVSLDLLAQGTPDPVALVSEDIQTVLARKLDLTILKGINENSVSISGVAGTSGVQTVVVSDMSNITYSDVLKFTAAVEDYELPESSLAWITNGKTKGLLKGKSKDVGSGRFLCEEGKIDGIPVNVCGSLPASDYDLFLGAWSNVIIGQWGGVVLTVDPYTGAVAGTTRLVVRLLCDIAITQPESFVRRVSSSSSSH